MAVRTLIRKLDSRSAPQLRIGAEMIVQSIRIIHIAVDAPLAEAGGDVEHLIQVVARGQAEFVMLEAGVFAGGADEGLVADDASDGRFCGEVDAGAFNHKIVRDAGLKIPA